MAQALFKSQRLLFASVDLPCCIAQLCLLGHSMSVRSLLFILLNFVVYLQQHFNGTFSYESFALAGSKFYLEGPAGLIDINRIAFD